MEGLAGFVLLLILAGLVLLVVWIILPFAVFGVKPLLRSVLHELRRQNDLLERAFPDKRPPLR